MSLAPSTEIENPSDDLLINEEITKITDSFLSSGKIPHAILFSGNEWVGKLHNAFFFAKKLLSFDGTVPEASVNLFGEEEPITFTITEEVETLVSNFSHPDLLYIDRDPDKGKNINVDQIRSLDKFLSLTPSKSSFRIAIINPIEELNINAANALLKALEEPTKNTVIILICHNKHKILDTIKSRCLCLDFKNLTEDTYYEYFNQDSTPIEEVKKLKNISNNSPYVAKTILNSNVTEIYAEFKNLLELNVIGNNKIAKIAKQLKEDKSGKTELNFYKLLLSDQSEQIKKTKDKKRLDNWFKILEITNNSKSANLDTLDCLKEIINIIKYI